MQKFVLQFCCHMYVYSFEDYLCKYRYVTQNNYDPNFNINFSLLKFIVQKNVFLLVRIGHSNKRQKNSFQIKQWFSSNSHIYSKTAMNSYPTAIELTPT